MMRDLTVRRVTIPEAPDLPALRCGESPLVAVKLGKAGRRKVMTWAVVRWGAPPPWEPEVWLHDSGEFSPREWLPGREATRLRDLEEEKRA